jgi:DNA-binding PadR family transcriptional regulator
LARLEDKGFVKATRPTSNQDYPGLPRPLYRLSADGSRVLDAAAAIGMQFAGAR